MWLLDHNIPHQLIPVIKALSISFDTAQQRKWEDLRNGELVATASAAGFTCIITRDILFREDASKALKKHPHMAVVLITLAQMPGKLYADAFRLAWSTKAITPIPGQLLVWPH